MHDFHFKFEVELITVSAKIKPTSTKHPYLAETETKTVCFLVYLNEKKINKISAAIMYVKLSYIIIIILFFSYSWCSFLFFFCWKLDSLYFISPFLFTDTRALKAYLYIYIRMNLGYTEWKLVILYAHITLKYSN